MEKINGVYLLGILAGQNFVILISGVCLIRHPGWKKIPKNNKHPRTYIRNRRVSTQFMKAKKITNVNLVAKHLLKEDIWICTFTRFMKTTKTISLCQAIGIALTDLHCFSTLRLKFSDTDIMYWNGNFNFKVIRCLWKMLQQKIHFWPFINIFVLEAMFQISICDS